MNVIVMMRLEFNAVVKTEGTLGDSRQQNANPVHSANEFTRWSDHSIVEYLIL